MEGVYTPNFWSGRQVQLVEGSGYDIDLQAMLCILPAQVAVIPGWQIEASSCATQQFLGTQPSPASASTPSHSATGKYRLYWGQVPASVQADFVKKLPQATLHSWMKAIRGLAWWHKRTLLP